jgi:hypothetical protein
MYGVRGEISFDIDDAELGDGSYVFYGYWTGPETAQLWGFEMDFRAIVETRDYGTRINVLEGPSVKDGSAAWFENRLELMREVESAARCLKEEISDQFPEMSDKFAEEIRGYYDANGFSELMEELDSVVRGAALTLRAQTEMLVPIFDGLGAIVREARIPWPMRLEGSPFNMAVIEAASRLRETRALAVEAAARGSDVPNEFFSSVDRAIDAMIASSGEHEEGSRRYEALRPRLSESDQIKVDMLDEELGHPDTCDRRRIEIWRELCGNKLVNFERRIDYVESLSNLLIGSAERVNESIRAARRRYGIQPPMDGYVEEINRVMSGLDGLGFEVFADALAGEFLEEANSWRSDAGLPRISMESLAGMLYPAFICVSVVDREGGPPSRTEIYVKGSKESFGGRVIHVCVIDGMICEMDIMERGSEDWTMTE